MAWYKLGNIKGIRFVVSAVFLMSITCCYVKTTDCSYIKQCGASLPLTINFNAQDNLLTIQNNKSFPDPTVQLLSVLKYDDKSQLLFRLDEGRIEGQIRQYLSYDQGSTWQDVDRPLLGQSDVKSSYSTRLVSHVDDRILYECYFVCKDGFPASTDGGETWTHVNPVLSNGNIIHAIQLMDTGMHLASRVYARIWTNVNTERIVISPADKIPFDYDFYIGVSDDYGGSFSLLPYGIVMLAESRNNPLIRYGLILSSNFNVSYKGELDNDVVECLAVSKNEGKSWEMMEGGLDVIRQNLYHNRSTGKARIWRQYPHPEDDEKLAIVRPVQIESDPRRPGYIYVFTSTGLYFSRDTGKTFRFANLPDNGWLLAIDRIAVDPFDGRYLYAIVNMEKFYRSSDYGCTWELMSLPDFPQ